MKKIVIFFIVFISISLAETFNYEDKAKILEKKEHYTYVNYQEPIKECHIETVEELCNNHHHFRNKKRHNQSHVGSISNVKYGEIIKVKNIKIKDDGSGVLLGTGIGAGIGSAIGVTGKTREEYAIAGAILGGLTGHHMNEDRGQELHIRLDNGKEIVTTYKINHKHPLSFRKNDYVKLIINNHRVIKIEIINKPQSSQYCQVEKEICHTKYQNIQKKILQGYKYKIIYNHKTFNIISNHNYINYYPIQISLKTL